jgi:CheY-like chemotaxis protein
MTKIKILVVDDEESLTRILKLNLEETGGYEVMTENKGANAITVAREFKPDLIILDVVMPDMMGSDISAEIFADDELMDIKIIFLTALVSKQEAAAADGEMADRSFVAKPVKLDELIDKIEDELTS